MGIHRYTYNQCVNADVELGLVQGATTAEERRWRTTLTKKENYVAMGEGFKNAAPCHTLQSAVAEYFRAKRAALSNRAAGNNQGFTMKKRSKYRSRNETVPFEKYSVCAGAGGGKAGNTISVQGLEGTFRVLGRLPRELRDRHEGTRVKDMTRDEIKIMRTRLGKYFAIITVAVPQRPGRDTGVCALDPGVRTFQTWYADDGSFGKIGSFDAQRTLLEKADATVSRLKKEGKTKTSAWRRHMRRSVLRTLQTVRDRTDDLHHKAGKFFADRFRMVLLPVFESSTMARGHTIHSKAVRSMMTWGHYRFREWFKGYMQLYEYSKVLLCNEAYTTRTCGRCGAVNHHVGSSKTFQCGGCGLRADRDYHAARNVLLRALPLILE